MQGQTTTTENATNNDDYILLNTQQNVTYNDRCDVESSPGKASCVQCERQGVKLTQHRAKQNRTFCQLDVLTIFNRTCIALHKFCVCLNVYAKDTVF